MFTCNLLHPSSNITISSKLAISGRATKTNPAQDTLHKLDHVTKQETIPTQERIRSEIMETPSPSTDSMSLLKDNMRTYEFNAAGDRMG